MFGNKAEQLSNIKKSVAISGRKGNILFKHLAKAIHWQIITSTVMLATLSACQVTAQPNDPYYTSASDSIAYSSSHNEYREKMIAYQQLLAPIALYPDSLLTHIFVASAYPIDVVEAARWNEDRRSTPKNRRSSINHSHLIKHKGWEPSVVALLEFPHILEKMNEDLSWTQSLGDAFIYDESQVLDAVQKLRYKAKMAGNLSSLPHVNIIDDHDVIVIVPARTQLIYVPYYDTAEIYGHWHWRHNPPVQWYSSGRKAKFARVFWHAGVDITFDFFFNAFHWRNKHIVVGSRANSRYYRPQKHIINNRRNKRWQHINKHRERFEHRVNRTVNRKAGWDQHRNKKHHDKYRSDDYKAHRQSQKKFTRKMHDDAENRNAHKVRKVQNIKENNSNKRVINKRVRKTIDKSQKKHAKAQSKHQSKPKVKQRKVNTVKRKVKNKEVRTQKSKKSDNGNTNKKSNIRKTRTVQKHVKKTKTSSKNEKRS